MFSRVIVFCALAAPLLCAADFEATYRKQGDSGETSRVAVKNGDVVMGDHRATVLYRANTKDIVAIDHEKRTYLVFDEATARRMEQQMADMREQMADAMRQLESQMSQMSEEQRAMMQQMLKQQGMGAQPPGTPRMAVQRVGKARVGGMSCEKYRVTENGRPASEACVVPPGSVGMSAADYRALLTATDNMRNMVERMTGGFTQMKGMDFRALEGVPVQVRDLDDGSVSVLATHSDAKLDASMFRVPEGYRQKQMAQ